jgi:hypothetical protein
MSGQGSIEAELPNAGVLANEFPFFLKPFAPRDLVEALGN